MPPQLEDLYRGLGQFLRPLLAHELVCNSRDGIRVSPLEVLFHHVTLLVRGKVHEQWISSKVFHKLHRVSSSDRGRDARELRTKLVERALCPSIWLLHRNTEILNCGAVLDEHLIHIFLLDADREEKIVEILLVISTSQHRETRNYLHELIVDDLLLFVGCNHLVAGRVGDVDEEREERQQQHGPRRRRWCTHDKK